MTDVKDTAERISTDIIASAERIESAYRINLDEAELRQWAVNAVKVLRVLTAHALASRHADAQEGGDGLALVRVRAALSAMPSITYGPVDKGAYSASLRDLAVAIGGLERAINPRNEAAEGQHNAAWLQGFEKGQVAAPSNPVVSDETRAALNQCRLALAGLVSVQSAVDMLDALSVNPQIGSDKP